MDIQNALLTPGSTHGRSGKALKPEGVIIHYVGNPGSSAKANRDYFENGSGGAHVSAHYIAGLKGEVLQCVPENERAAHAGKAYSDKWKEMAKTNNTKYLGVEVCHPGADGKFSDATYAALVELTADICARHGFEPGKDVLRHYDVTGKTCPLYYVKHDDAWRDFISDVTAALAKEKPPASAGKPKAATVSEKNLAAMVALGVMNSPDYWRTVCIEYLDVLLTKAAAPGILDKRVDNGITELETALVVLGGNGAVNTPDYWREVAETIKYVDALLINLANKSRIVLEKIIHAEACGEPFDGQVLVGNVIMNRCRDKDFPDGIYNAVFQPGQFSPVADGAYEKAVPSASVKKAVDAVLAGEDKSQGALYFRTTKGAAPDCWHERALTRLFDVGGHRFYK